MQAAVLVSAAFSAMIGRSGRADLKTPLAEIQAIHAAPDDVRRRCIVLAASEQQWFGENLLSVIARKPAGLTLDDVMTVLPMLPRLAPWRRLSLAHSGAQALLRQIEATWANLDDEDGARLRASILRVAPHVQHADAALALRKLAASGAEVPYDLIDDASEVGKALR